MPVRKQTFIELVDNISERIDVDDSRGRSVPVNMNFIEESFLAKDTGCKFVGGSNTEQEIHSIFNYEKKDGTSYRIQARNDKLQVYNSGTDSYDDLSPTYTVGARFGFIVYDDVLYGCNGVEDFFSWDGTTFNTFPSAPKGNILAVFEDRMFVSGVDAEPLTIYYTDAGTPTTFPVANVLKPLSTDHVTFLLDYYGTLLIFKEQSIYKLTFVYDQIVNLFVPKLESQSGNYGACSRQAVTWAENDVWFFTGREVRSIGFQDQQIGILGVNNSVLSEPIKETLYTLSVDNYEKACVFYYDRRFYLSIPLGLGQSTNNTTFVCHTLHGNAWTKYTDRVKSNTQDYMEIDGKVYTATSSGDYGVLEWDDTLLNDNNNAIAAEVFFDRFEDQDFNSFKFYRYLDLMFKDLQGRVTVTLKEDKNDNRYEVPKTFLVGSDPVSDDQTLGQVPFGFNQYGDSYGFTQEASPFQKKRVSFLRKCQGLTVGLSNKNKDETFTIAQMALSGHKRSRKQFRPANIISV